MRCGGAHTALIVLDDSFEDVADRNQKSDDPSRRYIETENLVGGACERSVAARILMWRKN